MAFCLEIWLADCVADIYICEKLEANTDTNTASI